MTEQPTPQTNEGGRKTYKKRTPQDAPAPSTDPESLMDTNMVARHLAKKNKMALTRLRKHKDPEVRLPPPDIYLSSSPHWRRRTIDAYLIRQESHTAEMMAERKRIADAAIAGRQAARAAVRGA